jgi:hypothetical protein
MKRPWSGQVEKVVEEERPAFDPQECAYWEIQLRVESTEKCEGRLDEEFVGTVRHCLPFRIEQFFKSSGF